jgi:hypothetical protein
MRAVLTLKPEFDDGRIAGRYHNLLMGCLPHLRGRSHSSLGFRETASGIFGGYQPNGGRIVGSMPFFIDPTKQK